MTRRPGIRIIALCLAGASTAGCGDRTNAEAYIVRDSAGVRIVENRAPQWTVNDGWQVAASPSMVIGAGVEDSLAVLHNVQGARRLDDGRIVIANDGSKQLLFFDSAGSYVRSVGRQGDGPGEFQFLMAFWLCGDSLRVYDGRLSRLSTFDRDGRFARSFQLRLPNRPQPPLNIDCQDDGKVILSDWGEPVRGGGIYRPTISVMIADPAGEIVATVGEFPGHEYVDGFTRAPVFGKRTSIRLHEARAYIGAADRYEIATYDLEGTLRMLVRKSGDRLPVTDDDISRYKEGALATISDPEARRRRQQFLDESLHAGHMPAYAAFMHDRGGNLWVEEFRRPWEEPPRWTVFTPEGIMLGTIEMPAGFALMKDGVEVGQIGDDFLLGVMRDELNVERVVLHRLIKR